MDKKYEDDLSFIYIKSIVHTQQTPFAVSKYTGRKKNQTAVSSTLYYTYAVHMYRARAQEFDTQN